MLVWIDRCRRFLEILVAMQAEWNCVLSSPASLSLIMLDYGVVLDGTGISDR